MADGMLQPLSNYEQAVADGRVGRPTSYHPEFAEQTRKLCLLGATDMELADFFGVCRATISNWKNQYPEFLEAMRDGKTKADAQVAHALYNRATGAEWIEEQAIKIKTGPNSETVEIVTLRRAAPPDTAAAIIWLKNRQPDKWRDTQAIQGLDKNGNPADGLKISVELIGERVPPPLTITQDASEPMFEETRRRVEFVG